MMINTFFEERVEQLFALLERARAVFERAGVEYRVVGGLATYIHVTGVDEDAGRLTKDVDIAVNRDDLPKIITAAAQFGFTFIAGVEMLVDAAKPSTARAVHLVFAREKVKPDSLEPTPDFTSAPATYHGVLVAPLTDLLVMKLTTFRLKDKVHVQDLDCVGLITPELEAALPPALRDRLAQVRATE